MRKREIARVGLRDCSDRLPLTHRDIENKIWVAFDFNPTMGSGKDAGDPPIPDRSASDPLNREYPSSGGCGLNPIMSGHELFKAIATERKPETVVTAVRASSWFVLISPKLSWSYFN